MIELLIIILCIGIGIVVCTLKRRLSPKGENRMKITISSNKLIYALLMSFSSGLGIGLVSGIIMVGGIDKIYLAIQISFPILILEYFFWYKTRGTFEDSSQTSKRESSK